MVQKSATNLVLFVTQASAGKLHEGGRLSNEEYENPFYRGVMRERNSSWEFDLFRQKARVSIEAAAEGNRRLQQLKRAVGFYVDDTDQDRVQVWFGKHYRRKLDKTMLCEEGATLLYSTSFVGGGIATTLSPAKSVDARVVEDRIYIRIGMFSGANMLDWIEKDLAALTAYAHVSSIDGSPMLHEKFRVWWLRRFHPTSIDEKHTQPSGFRQAQAFIEFTGRTLLIALLKPVAILIFILFLIAIGLPQLAQLVKI